MTGGGARGYRPWRLHSVTGAGAILLVIAAAGCAGPATRTEGEPGRALTAGVIELPSRGAGHVVFAGKVRAPLVWSSRKPNGGYLQLRYVRREPGGGWVDAQDVLAAFPEWGDPRSEQDVLADWPDTAVDQRDNIHVAWHGTANTRIYGNDEAFPSPPRSPSTARRTWPSPSSSSTRARPVATSSTRTPAFSAAGRWRGRRARCPGRRGAPSSAADPGMP